MKARELHSPKT